MAVKGWLSEEHVLISAAPPFYRAMLAQSAVMRQ